MGEDRTEGAQQDEAPKEYVTVGEAAKLLGVHRNTVHNRIKAGRIIAHKIVEGERDVYRIERDSLGVGRTSAHVHTLDAQRTTAGEELAQLIATRFEEIVHSYAHELGAVREQLGAERAHRAIAERRASELDDERRRREAAERERDTLRRELEALRAARESPQTVEEASEGAEPHPSAGEAQEGVQRRSWWRRMFGG